MLSERYNWDKKKSEQNEEENYADQLADMNKKMKDFVKTTSDFEGVDISHNTEIELDPAKVKFYRNQLLKFLLSFLKHLTLYSESRTLLTPMTI